MLKTPRRNLSICPTSKIVKKIKKIVMDVTLNEDSKIIVKKSSLCWLFNNKTQQISNVLHVLSQQKKLIVIKKLKICY